MCLPNFIKFTQIDKSLPVLGYRNWIVNIKNPVDLDSINGNGYIWKGEEGPHEVLDENSGLYSYNNYNNYNNYSYNNYNNNNNYSSYNNNNYNNYYYYYNYNNYYNYYYIGGIIHQWGKTAIHKTGYRSEYAKIITLFTIRRFDAKGTRPLLDWIDTFNHIIINLADSVGANTIHYQDYKETL